MPFMSGPLLVVACLAAFAPGERLNGGLGRTEQADDVAAGGMARAERTTAVEAEGVAQVTRYPPWRKDYFVFVKKGSLMKLGGMAGWHTEVSFCALKSSTDEEAAKKLLQPQLDNAPKSMTPEHIAQAREYLDNCFVTGHAGAHSMGSEEFASEVFQWFQGPLGERKLYYVGHVDLGTYYGKNTRQGKASVYALKYFLEDMRTCGNWESEDYNLLDSNCNHYTDALMLALHFRTPTTHVRLEANRTKDQGYMDVQEGVCKGAKCGDCRKGGCHKSLSGGTACFWRPQNSEIGTFLELPGTEGCTLDACSVGICNEGGSFDSATRACS